MIVRGEGGEVSKSGCAGPLYRPSRGVLSLGAIPVRGRSVSACTKKEGVLDQFPCSNVVPHAFVTKFSSLTSLRTHRGS